MLEQLKTLCAATDRRAALCHLLDEAEVNHLDVEGNVVCPASGDYRNLLCAHFDAMPGVPGANDDGAAVIELMNVLKIKSNFDVVFFADEEMLSVGRVQETGSYRFGRWLWKQGLHCRALTFDLCGIGDVVLIGHGDRQAADDLRRVVAIVEKTTPPSDDLGLAQWGHSAVVISLLPKEELLEPYPQTWCKIHSLDDCPSSISEGSMLYMVDVLRLLMAEGGSGTGRATGGTAFLSSMD